MKTSILALLMVAAMMLSIGVVAMAAEAAEVEPAEAAVADGGPGGGGVDLTTATVDEILADSFLGTLTSEELSNLTEGRISAEEFDAARGIEAGEPAQGEEPAAEAAPTGGAAPIEQHTWGEYLYFQDLYDKTIYSAKAMTDRENKILEENPDAVTRDENGLPTCLLIKGNANGEYIGYINNGQATNVEDPNNLTTAQLFIKHKFGAWTTTADCGAEGKVEWTRVCEICGKVETKLDKAPSHKWSSEVANNTLWGKIIEEPTCQKEGKAQDYCIVCGATREKYRPLQKTDHNLVPQIVKPVCQSTYVDENGNNVTIFKDGYMYLECSMCGYVPETLGTTAEADDGGKATKGPPPAPAPAGDFFTFKNDLNQDVETTVVIPDEAEETEEGSGIYKNSKIPVTLDYYKKNIDSSYDGHNWTSWNTTTAATCTTEGIQYRQCIRCGMDQHKVIAALGHDPVWQFTHQIDCFSAIEVYKCGRDGCGEVLYGYWKGTAMFGAAPTEPTKAGKSMRYTFVALEYDSLADILAAFQNSDAEVLKAIFESSAHEYDFNDLSTINVEESVNKTNEKNGTSVKDTDLFKLSNGKVTEIKKIPCNGQSIIVVYGCKYCDDKYVYTPGKTADDHPTFEREVDPQPHNWNNWTLDNQSTYSDGTIWYHWVRTCKVCTAREDYNCTFDPNEYAIHSPDECTMEYAEIISEDAPSCTEGGLVTKFCPICGKIVETEIAPLGDHSWNAGEVITAATCANGGKSGRVLYTCTVCGALEVRIVPAPSHQWVMDPAVAPEIGKPGKEAGRHCAVCGTTEGGAAIPALEKNTYAADASGIKVDETTVSGAGKVEKTGGNMAEEQLYARIVISFKRADETTYSIAVVVPVINSEFDAPVVEGGIDPITSVTVIICNTKNVSADWAGSNVAAPVAAG